MKKYLHYFTISFILIGLLIGYSKADYNYDPFGLWNRYYYIWDKSKDILLSLCILFPDKKFRWAWLSLIGFFVIRSVWQIFAIKDYSSASSPSVIFLLFLVEILLICITMLYPIIKEIKWKRQRLK